MQVIYCPSRDVTTVRGVRVFVTESDLEEVQYEKEKICTKTMCNLLISYKGCKWVITVEMGKMFEGADTVLPAYVSYDILCNLAYKVI